MVEPAGAVDHRAIVMAATARKLIVEVVEARDLLPKDGTGTSSPYGAPTSTGSAARRAR